jgi:hypothetical protein
MPETQTIKPVAGATGLNPADLNANWQNFEESRQCGLSAFLQGLSAESQRCGIASHARGRWFKPSRAHRNTC